MPMICDQHCHWTFVKKPMVSRKQSNLQRMPSSRALRELWFLFLHRIGAYAYLTNFQQVAKKKFWRLKSNSEHLKVGTFFLEIYWIVIKWFQWLPGEDFRVSHVSVFENRSRQSKLAHNCGYSFRGVTAGNWPMQPKRAPHIKQYTTYKPSSFSFKQVVPCHHCHRVRNLPPTNVPT